MGQYIDTHFYAPLRTVRSVSRISVPAGGGHDEVQVNALLLGVDEEQVRIDVLREDVLRIKISRGGAFDESPTFAAAFASPPEAVAFDWQETDADITLSTAAVTLRIDKQSFALDAHRADGSVIFQSERDKDGNSRFYQSLNDRFCITRKIGGQDAIYGLGEKAGTSNRRGRDWMMWNTDILAPNQNQEFAAYPEDDPKLDPRSSTFDPYYMTIPFFYHLPRDADQNRFAGFFVDNGYKGYFEFSDRWSYRYEFVGGQYTEYVFAGPEMSDVLEAYTWVTGRITPPPMWALGHHQCRWYPYDDRSLAQLAERYRRDEIPCDVLWLDIDYMRGYRVFTWNETMFPDRKALFKTLGERGFRIITIIDPGVKYDPGWDVFDEGQKGDYFCRTADGQTYIGQVWPGRTAFPDFVKPEVRAWWGRLNAEHVASGLAGIWNDMNEPTTGRIDPEAMRFDYSGRNWPHSRYHNQYGMLMAMGTVEGLLKAQPQRRTFVLSRAGFAGIQRYAANWMGDNMSRWEHLALSLPMACGLSISGQPFVGADVGGFGEQAEPELLVRWYQQAVFSPFFRNHSMHDKDQYPWSFGPQIEQHCREAIGLRYRLLPYIYTAFMHAAAKGEPVMRPMLYAYPHDDGVAEMDDQYLFGPDLLVAPVLGPGQTRRQVYLPAGSWYDWHQPQGVLASGYREADAPMDRIPVFARAGSVIPMLAAAPSSTMELPPESVDLHVFIPDADGEHVSELHEDDGLSFAHQQDKCVRTQFTVTRDGARVSVRASVSGQGFAEFARKQFRIAFHGLNASHVRVNGHDQALFEGLLLTLPNAGEEFLIEAKIGD